MDGAQAGYKVVFECLYGSLSSIAAMISCGCQLITDVVRGNLRTHEVGDFIVKTLKAGAKAAALEKGDSGAVGLDEVLLGTGWNGGG